MPALRELQQAFGAALVDGGAKGPLAAIEPDGLEPAARLAIHRHHVLTTLTGALRATYPVVCRLVDPRFFAYAAREFIRHHPPAGPVLAEYGAELPAFLASFPPCAGLAYLPDVARLEWALTAALHAPDAAPLDVAALAAVAGDDVARLRLRLDPSLALLASAWPVDRIWRANQPGAPDDGVVDLAAGGVDLEVRRDGDEVVFRAVDPAVAAFRGALRGGETLGDAVTAAAAVDAAFDVAAALAQLLDDGVLVGFDLAGTPEVTP
jgi:hypothetical protein